MKYIELHARSAFSFLRGSSLPEHLAETAGQLEMPAMALCDRDGVYGAPRFFCKGKETGIRPIIGAELTLEDGSILPVLVETRTGYQNLCRLLTRAHLRSVKGKSTVRWNELPELAEGLVALTGGDDGPLATAIRATQESGRRKHFTSRSGSAATGRFALPSFEADQPVDQPPGKEAAFRRTDEHALFDAPASERFSVNGAANALEALAGKPQEVLKDLRRIFGPQNLFVELQRHHVRGEDRTIGALVELAEHFRLPLLATNGVLYAKPSGRMALDVFTCIRHHTHLDAAGRLLSQNSERHLKDADQMRELFFDLPAAIENTIRLADRLQFSLENLGYEFPVYPTSDGESMGACLRRQTMQGARQRYGELLSTAVLKQLERELSLIERLGFAGYFLIVADIVKFCRDNDIMAQGRGSAANSAVCFSLGITAVDPVGSNLLFERFLSEGRKGWPDIDIDLPSGDRRERVIQEVYQRYGKLGAAMTANVITYRGRSAAREIGKALNISPDVLDRFSSLFANGDFPHTLDLRAQIEQAGLPRVHPRAAVFTALYQQIYGLPRHLGQHSGGMIICQGKLDSIVPLENASMPGRVVAQWDKDDCEELGIIKVDLLGLGMMSVLQEAIALTKERGHPVDLAKIPKDDPATYQMLQKADTIGVFQVESRAQMATLPRLKPACFYDVVIEVAIIRPGPIQGDLVHPYLARRSGKQPESYYHPDLRPVLTRTLGVPLFQEQMLKIAMVMADFSGSEAEELRRALSFHRSQERMKKVEAKLRAAMERKGHSAKVIEDIIKAIGSFALYGFPESHAISFALLAYGSAYLKAHYAPEFYASLLNNQPMGFYSPATIVKDAKRHGIKFRPVCVIRSEWRCTIESDDAIRLGFCVIQGLSHAHALGFLQQRGQRPFDSMEDFKRRAALDKDELRTLAEIGALNGLAEHRRDALWKVEEMMFENDLFSALRSQPPAQVPPSDAHVPADGAAPDPVAPDDLNAGRDALEPACPLPPMNSRERLEADYSGMDLTTGPHPMSFLRPQLPDVWRACDLPFAPHGQIVRIAGNVICRQRPGTAKGFVFISLEDETGISNAIVAPKLFERMRLVITQESFLLIEGKLQNTDNTVLVQARQIKRLDHGQLAATGSHDFH